jgi:hypothetical protein
MQPNPEDKKFIDLIKNLKEGDVVPASDPVLIVEGKFTVPTHFPFHQKIFDPGMILKVRDKNTRIYVPGEALGWKVHKFGKNDYVDRQIKDGKVLPADKGTQKQK